MRIGPYETVAEIGRGGYGTVFQARHVETGREVALKVLSEAGAAGSVEAMRFRREVELVRSLDHPGIVRVLDSGVEAGRPWFAMERIEGEPLYALLAREPLPWRRAVEIARDVADALAHAHARGVLHRDVKPGNILLGQKVVCRLSSTVCRSEEASSQRQAENDQPQTTGPRAFLTDFGLARVLASRSRLTRTGTALGTPEYMSPEQAQGEMDSLGPPTDVWGLGVVIYEMLAGRLAFDGKDPEEVIEKVVLREPTPLRRIRPDVPRDLERVVRVCLAKRPSLRYPDASALRDDLDRVSRGERLARRPARLAGRVRTASVAAAAVGMTGVLVASLLSRGPGPALGPRPAADRAGLDAEVLAGRARALRGTDARGAARLLGEALRMAPSRQDLRLERGLALWAAGDGPGARDEWSLVPEESPARSRALLLRGLEATFRLQRDELGSREGEADMRKVAAGTAPEARLARAALAIAARDWPTARESLREEAGWEAALLRGCTELSDPAGDPTRGLRELDQALAEGIPFPWVHVNRGVVRHDLGDHAGAIEDYTTALGIRPTYVNAFYNRASAREARGELAGAIEDFSAALRLSPDDPDALANRASVRRRLDDLVGAIEDCDAALRLRPDHAAALVNRANARGALGDHAGAAEDSAAALRIHPDLPEAYLTLAAARRRMGEWEAAAGSLREFLRRAPDDRRAEQARALLADSEREAREASDRGR